MLLLAAAAWVAAPMPSAAQGQSQRSICRRATSDLALRRGSRMTPRKPTELPDANFYSAVYRRIDGCEAPIVVKYGVSGR